MDLLVQLLQVPAHQVSHLHILEMVPAAFVPRVEIRGVSRQRFQPDLPAHIVHELPDLRPAVDRRSIPNHQQPLPRHSQQVPEELDAVGPVERLPPDQRVELVIGQLEEFARRVSDGLQGSDWLTRREIIRALVKRVEIEHQEVRIVYRVSPSPFENRPQQGISQHWWGRDCVFRLQGRTISGVRDAVSIRDRTG